MITAAEHTLNAFEAQGRAGVTDPHPYHRLMIAYRKEKKYEDELRIIKRAISVFEAQLKKFHDNLMKGSRKRSAVSALSEKISRQTGLTDRKGRPTHVPEPIASWQKRQATAERKLAAVKNKKTAGR